MERKKNDLGFNEEAIASLPNGAKLGWGLGKQPTRGPKGELSVKKIVDAAIEIADREGLQAASMNRIAASLGFTTMSLYRYVESKDDLLMLMLDEVCAVPIPPERPASEWREEMKAYVHACIGVFVSHPWFADIPITGVPIMPNNLTIIDWMLRTLRPFPLNDYEKMSIILLLSGYARSCGIIARDVERAIRGGSSPEAFSGLYYTEALKELVKPDRYPNLHPLVQSGSYTEENAEENTIGDDLDFGLERILDGIAVYFDGRA